MKTPITILEQNDKLQMVCADERAENPINARSTITKQIKTKVRATFPLTHRTLVPKRLQSRRGQFIHKFL